MGGLVAYKSEIYFNDLEVVGGCSDLIPLLASFHGMENVNVILIFLGSEGWIWRMSPQHKLCNVLWVHGDVVWYIMR